jgi:AcrR family transcriptional regulator
MSPKVPKAYLEARRAEILGAAWKCFIEKGFHNTTMQDIYDATNLSPGAVYNYFNSKEDIVAAAVKQFTDWSVTSLVSTIKENPNQPLYAIIRFWIDILKQTDNRLSFSVQLALYVEAARNEKIRATVFATQDATHAVLIQAIKNGQRSGLINPKLDPLSIARAFMGMLFGIMIHRMLDPKVDLDAYAQVFEAIFDGTFATSLKPPAQ